MRVGPSDTLEVVVNVCAEVRRRYPVVTELEDHFADLGDERAVTIGRK